MHYPSDVAAGEVLGQSVFDEIADTTNYRQDVEAARQELARAQRRRPDQSGLRGRTRRPGHANPLVLVEPLKCFRCLCFWPGRPGGCGHVRRRGCRAHGTGRRERAHRPPDLFRHPAARSHIHPGHLFEGTGGVGRRRRLQRRRHRPARSDQHHDATRPSPSGPDAIAPAGACPATSASPAARSMAICGSGASDWTTSTPCAPLTDDRTIRRPHRPPRRPALTLEQRDLRRHRLDPALRRPRRHRASA